MLVPVLAVSFMSFVVAMLSERNRKVSDVAASVSVTTLLIALLVGVIP